jgi:hypothetical protein
MSLEQDILSGIQNTNRILSELVLRTGANPIYATYQFIAASTTAETLGSRGAIGDFLAALLIVPATTSPGAVSILDSATSFTVFPGGASSVSTLQPFLVTVGIKSVNGAWKVTTGTNVSAIAMGTFR